MYLLSVAYGGDDNDVAWFQKTRVITLSYMVSKYRQCVNSFVLSQNTGVTDRQTDGRTQYRASIAASSGKTIKNSRLHFWVCLLM